MSACSSTRFVARKRTRSSVERSAQWMSSTTCTTGCSRPRAPRSPSTDWKKPSWCSAPSSVSPASSGDRSRTRSGKASSSRRAGVALRRRSAWASGANGRASPATGTQAPTRGCRRPCLRNSLTSRVLPTPVSPETTTIRGRPAAAPRRHSLKLCRQSPRPTRAATGLSATATSLPGSRAAESRLWGEKVSPPSVLEKAPVSPGGLAPGPGHRLPGLSARAARHRRPRPTRRRPGLSALLRSLKRCLAPSVARPRGARAARPLRQVGPSSKEPARCAGRRTDPTFAAGDDAGPAGDGTPETPAKRGKRS